MQFTFFGLNTFLDVIEIPKPKKPFGRMGTLTGPQTQANIFIYLLDHAYEAPFENMEH